MGLLLHELTHVIQSREGLYKTIDNAAKKVFEKNVQELKKLKHQYSKSKKLFERIERISVLLLKELHANTELIENGYGNYLIEYYTEELQGKKVCPRPVFYEKFKRAAKKDLNIINIAFEFEFALLSITLPFKKLKDKKAKKLTAAIKRCYEVNIQEIARKCHELTSLYVLHYSPSKKFQEMFLSSAREKVYNLLC